MATGPSRSEHLELAESGPFGGERLNKLSVTDSPWSSRSQSRPHLAANHHPPVPRFIAYGAPHSLSLSLRSLSLAVQRAAVFTVLA
jgi:hypothetical protein